jgi:hypothetical protein
MYWDGYCSVRHDIMASHRISVLCQYTTEYKGASDNFLLENEHLSSQAQHFIVPVFLTVIYNEQSVMLITYLYVCMYVCMYV